MTDKKIKKLQTEVKKRKEMFWKMKEALQFKCDEYIELQNDRNNGLVRLQEKNSKIIKLNKSIQELQAENEKLKDLISKLPEILISRFGFDDQIDNAKKFTLKIYQEEIMGLKQ